MYTNERVINDIADLIERTETDYPKSYQQLVKSDINNTILTAMQLRKVHLLTDPLGNKTETNTGRAV